MVRWCFQNVSEYGSNTIEPTKLLVTFHQKHLLVYIVNNKFQKLEKNTPLDYFRRNSQKLFSVNNGLLFQISLMSGVVSLLEEKTCMLETVGSHALPRTDRTGVFHLISLLMTEHCTV